MVASISARLRLSSTTDSMPRRCRRCESRRPAGPAPTMPTWVRIGFPREAPFDGALVAADSRRGTPAGATARGRCLMPCVVAAGDVCGDQGADMWPQERAGLIEEEQTQQTVDEHTRV